MSFDFDVLVIGSGFGGSVSRAAADREGLQGRRHRGRRRFRDEDFAETSFDSKRYLFRPEIGCYGIQRIDALQGLPDRLRRRRRRRVAGLRQHPLRAARRLLPATRSGAHITDWKAELAPYYDQAKRMLGVVENPLRTPSDEVMEKVADDMGVGDTFHPTPVGVFFGGPGRRPTTTSPTRTSVAPGPTATPCTRLRRVHDRLPAQRQEHPGQELPLPRRGEGRGGHAADAR